MTDDDLPRPRNNPRQRPGNVRKPDERSLAAEPPVRTWPDPHGLTEPDGSGVEMPARMRPDPRTDLAERRTRRIAPSVLPMAEAPVRQRRNPREQASHRPAASRATQPLDEPIQRIEQPAGYILAVLDLDGSALARSDRDILGASRALADEMGLAVAVLICGVAAEAVQTDAGRWGADRLVHLADPLLAGALVAQRVDPVIASIAMLDARHVLFNDTAMGGELGRRVAARLGERPAIGAVKLSADNVTCLREAGQSEVSGAPPRVIILRPESFDPLACAPRREARIVQGPATSGHSNVQDMGLLPVEPATLPLNEADLIVSAGNGVSDWSSFHDLALALGAAEGGSRVVVDAGHMPRDRQIGASGLLVAPRCYIALGISGASQHLDGIVDCPRVVAVNRDAHADIIKRADLAVVGDVQAIMPALARHIRGQA